MRVKFSFLIVFLTFACGRPDYLSERELNHFVQNPNFGLSKKESGNGIDLNLAFKPTDLLVAQELKGINNPSDLEVEKARNKFRRHLYFTLSLSRDNKEVITPATLGPDRFSDMLQTFSFKMGRFINLTTPSRDTIAVADYIYNRTFGMARSSDLLLVFDVSKCRNQDWIQFNLKEFGLGLGNLALRFEMEDIDQAPKIFSSQN